ncbi:MAG: hypothetical protein Q4B31_01410 [Clostridia bacterium]|nr:hypothetical protein [Clostridia bacterium]
MKKFVYFVLVVFLFSIFTAACKKENTAFPNNDKKEQKKTEERREEYVLIAEKGRLNLYAGSINGAPFESEPIENYAFPEEDIRLLEKGMRFDTIEQAYIVMENFVN